MKRALVLCPGRGSYSRDTMGSLTHRDGPALRAAEACRARHGRRGIRELDAMDRFSGRWHVAGEHASLLTAAVSLTDLEELDGETVRVVAVCGNSMGFYTALAFSGALSMDDGVELIETMAAYQAGNVIGGQLVWPLCDAEWRLDPDRVARLSEVITATPDLFRSIRLGGQAVIGGTGPALAAAKEQLGEEVRGAHSYPLRLPLHSAFHTPLLRGASGRARTELGGLRWRRPTVPLVDGRGHVWRPLHTDPAALADYTLGHQVTEAFDFTAMVRSALGDHGPDLVVLPGPGGGLGSAVAQVMIDMGWQGLRSRADFLARQAQDPVLVSMSRPEQRALVVAGP
jgi:malonyl CoA-acyl carrier protein transacylase